MNGPSSPDPREPGPPPSPPASDGATPPSLLVRFRRSVVAAIAFGALLYVGASVWAGIDQVRDQLDRFDWRMAVPVLLLTLANYSIRFAKWHYLLGRLGVKMPLGEDAWNFAAGLAMVISPGKAGELLKPWVVRQRTHTPMATTVPALVTERLTDGIAMLILAGIGVTTYAADKVNYLTIPAAIIAGGLAILASERATATCVVLLGRLPGGRRVAPRIAEMVRSARVCLHPLPLVLTVAMSVVAWGAECVGYWLVFKGLGVAASLDVCVFLYAFATVAGGAMPGGLGVADGALAGGATALISGMSHAQAVTAALLVRVATLWFGVALGAIALFRVADLLGGPVDLPKPTSLKSAEGAADGSSEPTR